MKPQESRPIRVREVLARLCGLAVLVLFLSGKNYCREDYELGTQSSVTATETETATATATDDDGLTDTPTETETATETETETETVSATATTDLDANSLFGALGRLGDASQPKQEGVASDSVGAPSERTVSMGQAARRSDRSDWLGKLYAGEDSLEEAVVDSDGDGYTDQLEGDVGSDPLDGSSVPPAPVTSFRDRLGRIDTDLDGLTLEDEENLGTKPNHPDSDADGVTDGAEVLSGSDPLDRRSRPVDGDGDGLSDDYENEVGTNPHNPDTDGDSVSDSLEIVLKSDPNKKDSDSDGILDGREVKLGSDPTVPEGQG